MLTTTQRAFGKADYGLNHALAQVCAVELIWYCRIEPELQSCEDPFVV
jgi:hypothetical protein